MASPNTNYTELSAVTRKYFVPKLVDNVYNSNALLQRMRKSNVDLIDGGSKIVEPLLYATTTGAGWYSGADTLDTTANEQITAAEFDLKLAYANITITREDELKNSGKAQVVNFVKSKVQAAEKTLADNIGTGLFNLGTTTNAIHGLRLICQGTGYTYGGISKTTYSWWRGNVSTETALSIKLMQSLSGDATIDNDKPTVVITTQDIYDDYYGLLQPQQRFMDSETAKGGFKNLLFNGIPVIVDSHCPAYHMFLLNEKYLSLKIHKDENFRFEPFIKPTNQNAASAKIYFAGALTCNNCRMNSMFTSLA